MLMCQCRSDECVKRAEWQCSNQLSKGCCLASKMQCKFLEHNHDQTGQFSMDDFLKPNNDLTNFIDFITQVTTNEDDGDEQSTHDTLVSNALAYGLIPEGDIPRDGSCMFHTAAQSLNVNMTKVRQNAAKWLRQNPTLNGVHFPDFVTGMTWECYLNGIEGHEWGDHLALVGIANAFQVTIGIVSSQTSEIQYIYPEGTSLQCIHLGHEFEFHYIRLVRLESPHYDGDAAKGTNTHCDDAEQPHSESRDDEVIFKNPACTGVSCLPDEVLEMIILFYIQLAASAAAIGLLRAVCPQSIRWQKLMDLSSDKLKADIYINRELFRSLEGNMNFIAGLEITWSVRKLLRRSGKRSGLAMQIRELLSEFHGWSNGAIRVRAIEPLGWFRIINFTPSKGK